MKRRLLVTILATVCFASQAVAQQKELVLAVSPDYDAAQSALVYQPLVTYLAKATGYKIKLATSRNYSSYWQTMRTNKGAWDLVFDEAHFTDYRAKFYKYEPLVRSAESTSYSLLTEADIGVNNTKSLIAENITTLSAPSLGYALLLDYFPNPMQQPEIRTNVPSWTDAIASVFDGESKAAMVPSSITALYSNMFEVSKTREFAGAAISASPTVSLEVKTKIKEALLKMHENQAGFEGLSELRISQFVPATAAEYSGNSDILKSFYGYGQ
jgi:ABC-type phosphate/phosphonate transport system substrate-binding protein